MAMVLAVTQRGLVSGIVLNDVGPEVDRAGLERIRGYAGKAAPVRQLGRGHRAGAQHLRHRVAELKAMSAGRKSSGLSYRANAQGIPEVDADPRVSELLRNTNVAAPDLWALWGALAKVPILAIRVGAQSDILSAATFERMQREKPDLKVLTVADRTATRRCSMNRSAWRRSMRFWPRRPEAKPAARGRCASFQTARPRRRGTCSLGTSFPPATLFLALLFFLAVSS